MSFPRALRCVPVVLMLASCGESKKPAAAASPPPSPKAATAPAPPPFDPVADAVSSYKVSASIAPAELKRGAKGQLAIEIAMARPDVHVQREFPLKVTLSPSAGLKISKPSLEHADAVAPDARDRRWDVGVSALGSGPQKVEVSLRFAICKEAEPAWCVVRNDTVSAAVEVR